MFYECQFTYQCPDGIFYKCGNIHQYPGIYQCFGPETPISSSRTLSTEVMDIEREVAQDLCRLKNSIENSNLALNSENSWDSMSNCELVEEQQQEMAQYQQQDNEMNEEQNEEQQQPVKIVRNLEEGYILNVDTNEIIQPEYDWFSNRVLYQAYDPIILSKIEAGMEVNVVHWNTFTRFQTQFTSPIIAHYPARLTVSTSSADEDEQDDIESHLTRYLIAKDGMIMIQSEPISE